MILFHIHDATVRPPAIRTLDASWTVAAVPLDDLDRAAPGSMAHCLFEVDVTALATALRIRGFVSRMAVSGRRIFACRRGDRHAAIQSGALGATNLVERPVEDRQLMAVLAGGANDGPEDDRPASVAIGPMALDLAFGSLVEGATLAVRRFHDIADVVEQEVGDLGIRRWLHSIRMHHSGTYQHCLVVTGLAAAFGREIGLSAADRSTLTVAALLHDIGKARIDPAVLDKPGRLTAEEFALVRMHPVWGQEHLTARSDTTTAVQDVVRHHHEALDGSGYPDGLAGRAIGDLTRLVTVADVFGALVEERSYKAAMPARRAFEHLVEMARNGKLEAALVTAFEPISIRLA